MHPRLLLRILPALPLLFQAQANAEEEVNFSREILPVLSDRCFHCHGPDESERKAGLRLDLEAEAKQDSIVVPGDAEASELWYRITTADEDDLMPPPDSHRDPLTPEELAAFRKWLDQGAKWGKHWAFEPPTRTELPDPSQPAVDAFVQAKLKTEGLEPSPPAPPHTQLRRLSFALTGLPPTTEELAAFTQNPSNEAWAEAIERYLASPYHGERLAMWWLDAARYSDTDGYQQDAERDNWPWRDWVVDAFNQNMPFDQFTIEQFAGDLLPDATPEQILAPCFQRNHMTDGEGGRLPEESRIDYVIDRVNTTGTVWLGLTLGCAQCHTHKFDPVSHEDYYRFFAFFNSIDEDGTAGRKAKPYLKYKSDQAPRAMKELEAHLTKLTAETDAARVKAEAQFADELPAMLASLPADYQAWQVLSPSELQTVEGSRLKLEPQGIIQAIGPDPRQEDYRVTVPAPKSLQRITGWKLEVMPHPSHTEGKLSRGAKGEFILTNVKLLVRRQGASQVRDIQMKGAIADFEKPAKGRAYGKVADTLDDDPRNGWTTETGDPTQPHVAQLELEEPLQLSADEELVFVLQHRSTEGEANIGRFRLSATSESGETVQKLNGSPLEELAAEPIEDPEQLSDELRQRLLAQFLQDAEFYQDHLAELNAAKGQLNRAKRDTGIMSVMVLSELEEPRATHILERGVWDAHGAEVQPGVPDSVLPWPDDKTSNRLDLAQWLVSPENPLTARVIVNHLWQMTYGAGLVRTPEDFGLQGELPTHPELLDWLALELIDSGWDLRHVLRLIVNNDTFRQSSDTTAELRELDPDNRLLARAPRHRLPAWMIRDNALAASGLLNPALGGPPVRPWQPEGVWQEIFMGRFTYNPSLGPAQYRRTLYAYWRRSSAPTFLFDSAQRRVCEVGIRRTNTPLHALTLLNDTTMLEASRVLADQALAQSGSPSAQMQWLSMAILGRSLQPAEVSVLEHKHRLAWDHYQNHPEDATAFTTVGQQDPPPPDKAADTAAWMTAASLLLNLDEAISYE